MLHLLSARRIGLVAKMTIPAQLEQLNLTTCWSWLRLLRQGDNRYEKAGNRSRRPGAVLFTSGTTGANKGRSPQRNLTTVVPGILLYLISVRLDVGAADPPFVRIQPACARMHLWRTHNDSLMHVGKNLLEFRPGMSLMVPMIVESLEVHLAMPPEAT